mmetsp:Transcript_66004/g.166384  ORF Transcript_66004/g.166384 Transcript_66004/m.166384 type:complete len:261 (+) Transcript_66004:46-828(+)
MCGPALVLADPKAGFRCTPVASAFAVAESCAPEGQDEDSECPKVLRSSSAVPELLEEMNQSAEHTNKLELHASQAEVRYRQRLAHWSRLHRNLIEEHGARSVDRARRYFEAEEALQAAAERIRNISQQISAAGQDAKAAAGVEVNDEMAAQGKPEHEVALACFSKALRSVEYWRAKAGEKRLDSILPSLRLLREHAKKLDTEQERIAALSQRIQASKARYRSSMVELERISNAIHERRSSGSDEGEPEYEPVPTGSRHEA